MSKIIKEPGMFQNDHRANNIVESNFNSKLNNFYNSDCTSPEITVTNDSENIRPHNKNNDFSKNFSDMSSSCSSIFDKQNNFNFLNSNELNIFSANKLELENEKMRTVLSDSERFDEADENVIAKVNPNLNDFYNQVYANIDHQDISINLKNAINSENVDYSSSNFGSDDSEICNLINENRQNRIHNSVSDNENISVPVKFPLYPDTATCDDY